MTKWSLRFPAGTMLTWSLRPSLRCASPQWAHHSDSARLALAANPLGATAPRSGEAAERDHSRP
ncbi:MAG: hypothetical protein ACT4NL_08770, partial [Pseudomarimonas sp.]